MSHSAKFQQNLFPHPQSELHLITRPLTLRALNQDNIRDAKKVAQLFEHQFGSDHPLPETCDPRFWMDSRPEKFDVGTFMSLLILDGEELIAHLGINHFTKHRSAQLMLPAIRPEYKNEVFRILRFVWGKILVLAARQHWSSTYQYNLTSEPVFQLLASRCFGSEAIAFMPCRPTRYGFQKFAGTYAEDTVETGTTLLVMQTVLDRTARAKEEIFVPQRHREIVQRLLAGLKIERRIVTDSLPLRGSSRPRSEKAMFLRHLKPFGVFRIRAFPSNLKGPESLLELIGRIENSEHCSLSIQLDLSDPKTPLFAERLEAIGYSFAGILPLIDKYEYICFSRLDRKELSKLTLSTAQAKTLRDYIVTNIS